MSFLGQLRALVWAVLDGVVICLIKPAESQRHVLIVRPDAIGDFVLWSHAGRELCAHYKNQGYSVVLLGNVMWAQWANDLGLCDEVWALDANSFVRNLWYRWSWLWRLRRAGFAKVIHPVHSRQFLIGDALVRATNAGECIAPEGDLSNIRCWLKRWSDRWYSRLIPESSPHKMELQRHAEFMRSVGFSNFLAQAPVVTQSKAEALAAVVSRPYVVLVPGAGLERKCWSVENFGEIGRRLIHSGFDVVLVGGHADCARADEVRKCMAGNVMDFVGKTTLAELAELLRNAVVVVANDTSAAHIGAAVGSPVVCILGGGNYGRFFPYIVEKHDVSRPAPQVVVQYMPCFGCNWRCIYPREQSGAVKCISDISVEQVWCQLEQVLPARIGTQEPVKQDS